MAKYFVYRKKNSHNQYWSVDKGWSKYEWATVYSQDEVDRMCDYGFDPSVLDGEWVRHEPPKPTPVIIDDGVVLCENEGYYYAKHRSPNIVKSFIVYKQKGTPFSNFFYYVYIPEPNWPN